MNNKSTVNSGTLIVGYIIFFLSFMYFLFTSVSGLRVLELGDETEKFVAAQLINTGMRLYSDIFAHHSPLTYVISHLYSNIVSNTDFSYIRIVQIFLALISCLAIVQSPVFSNKTSRLWAGALYLYLLSSIWGLQSINMVLYQPISGFLLVIALTQLVVPLLLNFKPSSIWLSVSGACIVLASFSAITVLIPSAAFLCISLFLIISNNPAARDRLLLIKPIAYGSVLSFALMLVWMMNFADITGFIIYGIYFNIMVYSNFIGYNTLDIFKNLFFSFSASYSVYALGFILNITWSVILYALIRQSGAPKIRQYLSLAALIVAVYYINPRGEFSFKGSALLILNISLFALTFGEVIGRNISKEDKIFKSAIFGIVGSTLFCFQVVNYTGLTSPHGIIGKDWRKHVILMKPDNSPVYEFIRSFTKQNGDVISTVFTPGFYIFANRLPASGHFYYLPWQAKYNENPLMKYSISICDDLRKKKPSIIYFDNWLVWDSYKISDYEPCVYNMINNDYFPIVAEGPYFLRKDRYVEDGVKSWPPDAYHLVPTVPLDEEHSVTVRFGKNSNTHSVGLKRIGILFSTHNRYNSGDAELRLIGSDGQISTNKFSLAALSDNRYKYFYVNPDNYIGGEILVTDGGGVSVWESHSKNDDSVSTCIIFEYSDDRIQFTSGCPPF